VLEIAIRRSKVEIRGNVIDKCSQIMAYADDVVVMGRRLQDVEERRGGQSTVLLVGG